MAVPATVIYFTCYDQLCAALRLRMGDYSQEAPLVAGAIARGELTAITSLKRKKKSAWLTYCSILIMLVASFPD